MKKPRFTIVTATAGAEKAEECFTSWQGHGVMDACGGVLVGQHTPKEYSIHLTDADKDTLVSVTVPDYLGPVPAFKLGVDLALQITAPDGIIACLHDDLLIEEPAWDAKVMAFFNLHPEVGLVGFGGGTGLGSDDIYKSPYNPMQLARQDFVSNMRDAEAHGRRVTEPTRVACLDGFSQIGRVAFWLGNQGNSAHVPGMPPLWTLEGAGVIHHAYDAYLGAWAHNRGWHVYMLPIACHHYGGQTAVADAGYQEWACKQAPPRSSLSNDTQGDARFWEDAHQKVYDLLRGVLPLRF